MNKIQKLDKHLMNMIAAGEVVERPAGIVKELVENAIDAHATVIEVTIKSGGIDSISVLDNGDGMSRSDALLAFERHATSKLKEESDLWSIGTLGFRGEAIPSIASVSKVSLKTNNSSESTIVEVHYGEVHKNEAFAFNKGTEIIVEGLFHKTPARLKSFKSVNYERAIIISTLEKFAFSYPEISFILSDEHKEILHTSGNNNLTEIMYHVYGKEVARQSFEFNDESEDFKVSGVLVRPSETRANRNHIQLFVNNRMVKSYKLSSDVISAYKHLMFSDRFPIAILKFEMDYQLVDVNVHPSKWEVRIQKERILSEFITSAVKKALNENMRVVEAKTVNISKDTYEQFTLPDEQQVIIKPEVDQKEVIHETPRTESFIVQEDTVEFKYEEVLKEDREDVSIVKDESSSEPLSKVEEVLDEQILNEEFLNLRAIGQYHGKYILAESFESLYIIDQHAAEERVNFEKIRTQIKNNRIEATPLLIPTMIDIKSSEAHLIERLIEAMSGVGLVIENFSETSIIVREIPLWLMKQDTETFVLDVLEHIKEHKDVSIESLRYDVIATKACKASIKFNHSLSPNEINQVLLNLSKTEHPYHCPHGRPTLIKITEKQLIKEFMR